MALSRLQAQIADWLSMKPDQCATFDTIRRWARSGSWEQSLPAAIQIVESLRYSGLLRVVYGAGDKLAQQGPTLWDPPLAETIYQLTDPSRPPLYLTDEDRQWLAVIMRHNWHDPWLEERDCCRWLAEYNRRQETRRLQASGFFSLSYW